MVLAYLSIGSNINSLENIKSCISLLKSNLQIKRISSIYKTKPWGNTNQDDFLNLCVEIETDLDAEYLLRQLQSIEKKLGRKRTIKWGSRTIDLDIIFYGNKIIDTEDLKIPHPLMHERAFVLVPLNEINSKLNHPKIKKTVEEMLKGIDKSGVIKVG